MATFVLVHGSCHGGWCWKKVTPLIRKYGHDVYFPDVQMLFDGEFQTANCTLAALYVICIFI